jgi:hypothetical protein
MGLGLVSRRDMSASECRGLSRQPVYWIAREAGRLVSIAAPAPVASLDQRVLTGAAGVSTNAVTAIAYNLRWSCRLLAVRAA